MTETDIQKAITTYLQIVENQGKLWFMRTGSGVIKTEAGNWFKSGKAGCPDIVCCIKGRFVGFEVKTAKGKLTELQEQARRNIEGVGGVYHVVRSVDDVIKILESEVGYD